MIVAIGIGSNIGDRLAYIQKATSLLQKILKGMRSSTILESSAHLLPGSPSEWNLPYLNCAVMGHTTLGPYELLRELKAIEREMDAVKIERWAPRKIDLDILAYGDLAMDEEHLTIPHKELLNRPFALYPLGQLLPYWRYPVEGSPFFGHSALRLMHDSTPDFHRSLVAKPYLIGILNVTPDSFSDGGLYAEKEKAVDQALHLWKSGASFIDLGAASTRPGSSFISAEEEWRRLCPILEALPSQLRLSIDTYNDITALKAIDTFDVDMINFVGPEIGQELAAKIEKEKKQLVCMHSLSLPHNRGTVLPLEKEPMSPLLAWAETTLLNLGKMGVDRKRIILDPGIGFGKTAAQCLIVLKRMNELKTFGVPLLVGHSRKSFISSFSKNAPAERDWQSAAFAIHLMEAGVDYLRVHDVDKHMELLAAHQSLIIGETHD